MEDVPGSNPGGSKMNRPECIRCGACCANCPCGVGKERADGGCTYLFFRKGMACCLLLEKSKIRPETIGIGQGCILQIDPAVYAYYKEKLGGRNEDTR
jgi:hypothetical protein